MERARLAAVEGRHKLEEKYFTIKQSAGQIPASPVQQLSGGYFKPKDSTPEEVERARLAALESRRKLEEKYFAIQESASG